jgi:hypothetical protein
MASVISPPPPSLGGGALRSSCALAVYKPPPQENLVDLPCSKARIRAMSAKRRQVAVSPPPVPGSASSTFVIIIAGGSGSGRSVFCARLQRICSESPVAVSPFCRTIATTRTKKTQHALAMRTGAAQMR